MYPKKCEVCGREITDARRVAVSHSPVSETCSENCAVWLSSQVKQLTDEALAEIVARKTYGAETTANAYRELQARGFAANHNAPQVIQSTFAGGDKNLRTCPACGRPTDSLKRYHMINIFICLIIAFSAQRLTYTSCPDCMRKKIAERALINIIPANVAFPIIFVMFFIQFCRTFVSGHTRG